MGKGNGIGSTTELARVVESWRRRRELPSEAASCNSDTLNFY